MPVRPREGSPYLHYDFTVRRCRFRGSCETSDRETAELIESQLRQKALIQAVTGTDPDAGKKSEVTLGEALARYFVEIGQHAATWDDIARYAKRLNAGLGRNKIFSTITSSDVSIYIATRRGQLTRLKEPPSNASINREVENLRTVAIRAATIWKVAAPDIVWEELLLEEAEQINRELKPSGRDDLFEHLRPDFHGLVRFVLVAGVRLMNAVELTWRQVDWDNMVIRFKVKSKKPGGKLILVPITREIAAILSAERGRHPTRVFTYVCQQNRFDPHTKKVWRKGQRYPFTKDGWRRAWRAALKSASITDFRFHDLRHTFGNTLLRQTGNLALVQKAMGHQDIKSTLRYAVVLIDDVRAGMEATDDAASRARHSDEIEKPKVVGGTDV